MKSPKKTTATKTTRRRAGTMTVTLTASEALALCTAVDLAIRTTGAPPGRIGRELFGAIDKIDTTFGFNIAGE